jgi:hypothetical protein
VQKLKQPQQLSNFTHLFVFIETKMNTWIGTYLVCFLGQSFKMTFKELDDQC